MSFKRVFIKQPLYHYTQTSPWDTQPSDDGDQKWRIPKQRLTVFDTVQTAFNMHLKYPE